MSNENQAFTVDITSQIKSAAASALVNGITVKIDRVLPSILIKYEGDPDGGHHFQESEADGILHEADEQAGFYGVTTEEYLAFVSQNW